MSEPVGPRFPFRLLLLTAAAFVSVTSEFLPTAVLPLIADELRVSESQVGLLVSLFAMMVVLFTTPLTLLTRRFSRKWLLVAILGLYALANLAAAAAPTYEALVGARVFAGLTHGLFWGVVSPYAARLVPRTQVARAISLVTAGGTLAFILGMPAGAAVGLAVGWRMSFVVAAAVSVAILALAAWLLPTVRATEAVAPASNPATTSRPRFDRSAIALLIVGVTALVMATGHLVLYAYITPWSLVVADVGESSLSLVLGVYGVAGLIGLFVAGSFGDRHPRLIVNLLIGSMLVGLIGLGLWGQGALPVMFFVMLWGAGFGGLPAALQTRMLHAASARLRDLSGGFNSIAFNLAIACGAFGGGVMLDTFGLTSLPWFAAALVALSLIWTIATDRARIRAHPADAHLG
jgi:DHA1 family inner membrane transport protein